MKDNINNTQDGTSCTVSYTFADGHTEQIAVSAEFAAKYAEFEKDEQRREWREKWRKRHKVSLEGLAAAGKDIIDPINRDPLEMLIEQEEKNVELPPFTDLTEYQRRVANKFYVEHKTQAEIAREEGVSQQTISRLINKIQKKVINAFD